MHPANDIRGVKSTRLSNKKIILGITGSIACVECVRLSRELIRHGADVIPVMTKAATELICPDALWFATGNQPIIKLTGKTEHVFYCGRVKDPADLLLISPCTSNTISKIAHGIDDTPVTTFASTAIGSRIPIMIVPAMHLSMYDHKIIQSNIKKCKKIGIDFVDPNLEGNKAKMAGVDEIVANVIRKTGKKDLSGKNILIIGGSTSEKIDDVRNISNTSSGKTAVWLAKNCFFRGADTTLWYGQSPETVPNYIKKIDFSSNSDILKLLKKTDMKNYDMIFICAAISDYTIKKHEGKISSDKETLEIKLKKTEKIISKIRKISPNSKIVGFKLEDDEKKLKNKSFDFLKQNKLDLIVGNTLNALGNEENKIFITNKKGETFHKKGKKEEITNIIIDYTIK